MEEKEKNLVEYDAGAEHYAEPPIESQIVPQKKSLSKKIAGALLSDTYQAILGNIYQEIIDPAIRRLLVEAFKAFIYRGKTSTAISDSYTSYDTLYDRSLGGSEDRIRPDFGEIQFKSKESAERVLEIMRNYIRKNGLVRVSDYYKISGQKPEYTYVNYGWTNINSAYTFHYSIKGERMWSIHFPEPMRIESN